MIMFLARRMNNVRILKTEITFNFTNQYLKIIFDFLYKHVVLHYKIYVFTQHFTPKTTKF